MIEIEWGSEKSGIHTLTPFAWFDWPACFLDNRAADLREVLGIRPWKSFGATRWHYYTQIYSHRKWESPEDFKKRIDAQMAQCIKDNEAGAKMVERLRKK